MLTPVRYLYLFLSLALRAILYHIHYPAVVPPNTDLKPPILIAGGARRVVSGDTLERRRTIVAHTRRQPRIAAGVNAGGAARECDVGVTQDSEGYIAVDEASIWVAELGAVVTGVAVGEPSDV